MLYKRFKPGVAEWSIALDCKSSIFMITEVQILSPGPYNSIILNMINTKLIKQNLNEVLGEEELQKLIESNTPLVHYIGFEISGLVHLGTGISSMIKIRDLQKAGVKCNIFLADWHTWINNKLRGDHTFIKEVSKDYFQPALEVCAEIVGANVKEINFIHGSDLYHNNDKYWQSVIEISKNLTLSRVLKSTSIMGRDERNSQPFAWLVYPPMQVADIFALGVNITHSGTDQRKIHVIAREVAPKLAINSLKTSDGETIKPVAIHHDLLLGLQKPHTWPLPEGNEKETVRTEMKMSKSVQGSAIFIHDSEEEIRSKVNSAFCPEKEVVFNPVLNWVEHLILPLEGKLLIKREDRFGGDILINDFEELKNLYINGDLHPMDLKNAVAENLLEILRPARKRFEDLRSQELIDMIKK